MQKSKPEVERASRTSSESGGLRSEKRVSVNALFGFEDSVDAMAVSVNGGGRGGRKGFGFMVFKRIPWFLKNVAVYTHILLFFYLLYS